LRRLALAQASQQSVSRTGHFLPSHAMQAGARLVSQPPTPHNCPAGDVVNVSASKVISESPFCFRPLAFAGIWTVQGRPPRPTKRPSQRLQLPDDGDERDHRANPTQGHARGRDQGRRTPMWAPWEEAKASQQPLARRCTQDRRARRRQGRSRGSMMPGESSWREDNCRRFIGWATRHFKIGHCIRNRLEPTFPMELCLIHRAIYR
jgi:hypothetical protein